MNHTSYRVLLDANILYSKTLRDWILLLAINSENSIVQVLTSQPILDEYAYHWRRSHPLQSDSVRKEIMRQIRGTMFEVVEGFDVLEVDSYPDSNDLHVHSAAIFGEVDALVTNDRKLLDFAAAHTRSLGYQTLSADGFLLFLADTAPVELFVETYRMQLRYALSRSSDSDLGELLDKAGAPEFARFIRQQIVPLV